MSMSSPVKQAQRAGKRAGKTIGVGLAVAAVWLTLLAAHNARSDTATPRNVGAASVHMVEIQDAD